MGGLTSAVFGSKPKPGKVIDTTPEEFAGLRAPVASQLRNIIGAGGLPAAQGPFAAGITDPEQQLLQQLMGMQQPSGAMQQAQGTLMNFMGGQANPFAGAAGMSPAEMQGLQQIQGSAFGMDPNQMAGRDLLGQTLGGQFLSPDSNPFLQAAIEMAQRPILEQFGDLQQQQRSDFTRAGQRVQPGASSPFDVANARLTGGVASALGDVGTQMAFQNMEAERQRQMQAMGMAEQFAAGDLQQMLAGQQAMGLPREIAQGGLDRQAQAFESGAGRQLQAVDQAQRLDRGQLENTLQVLQAQALPRMIEQMGIDRGLQEFQRQQETLLRALGAAGQMSQPSTVQTPGTPGSGGLIGGIAGAAGTAIGGPIGGAIGSSIGNMFSRGGQQAQGPINMGLMESIFTQG